MPSRYERNGSQLRASRASRMVLRTETPEVSAPLVTNDAEPGGRSSRDAPESSQHPNRSDVLLVPHPSVVANNEVATDRIREGQGIEYVDVGTAQIPRLTYGRWIYSEAKANVGSSRENVALRKKEVHIRNDEKAGALAAVGDLLVCQTSQTPPKGVCVAAHIYRVRITRVTDLGVPHIGDAFRVRRTKSSGIEAQQPNAHNRPCDNATHESSRHGSSEFDSSYVDHKAEREEAWHEEASVHVVTAETNHVKSVDQPCHDRSDQDGHTN